MVALAPVDQTGRMTALAETGRLKRSKAHAIFLNVQITMLYS
jgi:hypothetical protein